MEVHPEGCGEHAIGKSKPCIGASIRLSPGKSVNKFPFSSKTKQDRRENCNTVLPSGDEIQAAEHQKLSGILIVK